MGDEEIWTEPRVAAASKLLLQSYAAVVGRRLLASRGDEVEDARALFEAPFAVLAHGTEDDPIFFYGNATALRLWDMSFHDFTHMPSRLTAEPMLRDERRKLLEAAALKGFIDDYAGVRISSGGARFRIENVTLWTVMDASGINRGQAAYIPAWTKL